MNASSSSQSQNAERARIRATIDALHRDVYIAYYEQKMTLEEIGNILHLSRGVILEMLLTYQERKERGAIA